MTVNNIIIDTDAGIDDAIALIMGFNHPDTEVIGITTVSGNVGVDQVVRNVQIVLNTLKQKVPVFRGSSRPLFREPVYSQELMGEDGLGNASHLYPILTDHIPDEAGALALVRMINDEKRSGPLTLIALGPLTNLAIAVRLDPRIVSAIDSLVVMGGAMEARGNITPAAEFNFFADPEAASIIFNAGFKNIQVVPWETSIRAMIQWKDYNNLVIINTQLSDLFYNITKILRVNLEKMNLPGMPLPDCVAIACALDSSIIIKQECVPIDIETQGVYGRGLMAVDWQRTIHIEPNAHLITEINQDIFQALLQRSLQSL